MRLVWIAAAVLTVWASVRLDAENAKFAIDWHETVSPHFRIRHEPAFLPQGFVLKLEGIHSNLSRDLSRFSPWMAKERVTLYFYGSHKSYLAGEFEPPSWSNGLAYFDRKILVIPNQPDKTKLMEVTAHEMTHLLFESYWGQSRKEPPHWLNEGLAMMEESQANNGRQSEWHDAMGFLTSAEVIPFGQFIEMAPGALKDQKTVGIWYVQAYSIVYFLYHEHGKSLSLFNFCQKLRDGATMREALWTVYRYPDMPKFQAAWSEWLKLPQVQKKVAKSRSLNLPQKGGRFSDFTFHSFSDKN